MIEIKKGTTRISSNSKSNGRKQVYDGKSWRPCCSTEGCTNRTENNKCKKCSNPKPQVREIKYTPNKEGILTKRIYIGGKWAYCCKECDEASVKKGGDICNKCKTGNSDNRTNNGIHRREKNRKNFKEQIVNIPNILCTAEDYETGTIPIKVKCTIHNHTFKQRPNKIKLGHIGCEKCLKEKRVQQRRKSHEDFVRDGKRIHGDKFNYIEEYKGNNIKIQIQCIEHNSINLQRPSSHLNGQNPCPECYRHGYSKGQIEWLNFKMVTIPDIRHMLNHVDKEYKIPNSNYSADGYSKKENTIFEYHGDRFHGNPELYDPNEIFPLVKKTYGELYDNTMEKQKFCEESGFKYVFIWESKWNRGKNAIIHLQRRWREILKKKGKKESPSI
jgi:hypothetical protein